MLQRRTRKEFWQALFHRRRDDDITKTYMSIFTALQVDRPGHSFVAIKCAASDAGNFLVINDGLAVLHHGDCSSYECDVEGLPLSGFARQLRRRRDESV